MKSLVIYDWPEGQCKQVACIDDERHGEYCFERRVIEFFAGIADPWRWIRVDMIELTHAPLAESRFLAAYADGPTKQIEYVGPDKHIYEMWVKRDHSWQVADLTMLTGAPPVWQIVAGYAWSVGQMKQVVYIGDDGHIHELWAEKHQPWRHIDLTAVTNAPLPTSHYMVAYGWDEGRCKQVAYVGPEGQIHELYMPLHQSWKHVNLSALLPQAPRAVDLMVGFEWPEGRSKQIAYVSEDGHVQEFSVVVGESWRHTDVSMMTGAPPAIDVLTGYPGLYPLGGTKQIAYVGMDRHIIKLTMNVGGRWWREDLTEMAHAPVSQTAIEAIDGCTWSAWRSEQVVYVNDEGIICELVLHEGQWKYDEVGRLNPVLVGV